MGASHASFFTDAPPQLPNHTVEQRLYPGSGRMMRTYKLRHNDSGALLVCKFMYVTKDDEEIVQKHVEELRRIKENLQDEPHIQPFVVHILQDYQTRSAGMLPIRSVLLLRPHVYTTLSDRLASRPFLHHVEKLWILYQLLNALQCMHDKNVVHGFLTTENIGLTSWNYLILHDIASYKPQTALPDDDPSEYLYYYQELNKHGTDTTPREKRCYLAPERFTSDNNDNNSMMPPTKKPLTPAMDMFSAGCVVMETFLNGERALDLGDLMEYRSKGTFILQQKLNKIESSSLRAACRHMLHLDPEQRLSAKEYLERLDESVMPTTFSNPLSPFLEKVTNSETTPDARMALAASVYEEMLKQTVGAKDPEGARYFCRMLGPTLCDLERGVKADCDLDERNDFISEKDQMLSETEALLQKLDSLKFDDEDEEESAPTTTTTPSQPLSTAAASSLLIYLQLTLSTVRNVQRPSSKLVGLQLLQRCGKFSSDEAKLQRIVPVAISLLHDPEPLVRATAIQVITTTMSTIKVFPPSDSKIFQQYIFKRMAHLISDQSLVVRVTFARCIALLADTALRFLDISHAVRLYEAVGAAGGGNSEVGSAYDSDGQQSDVFTDDVARLLGGSSHGEESKDRASPVGASGMEHAPESKYGTALIDDSYTAELAALQEVVSRWVVLITTDQSGHSSPTKRSLLCDLTRLCNFFGRDGVMAFILPQILAFLNDRRDWQLRAALFHRLPAVCYILGRAATEHFVLPCLETALVDSEDEVIDSALRCLTSLVEMGLTSRSILVTPPKLSGLQGQQYRDLFERYLPLLLFPASNVRRSAIGLVNACFKAFGFPDGQVFLLPLLRPYLRFEPRFDLLTTREGLEKCLMAPLSRDDLYRRIAALSGQTQSVDTEQWTTIDPSKPSRAGLGDKMPKASPTKHEYGSVLENNLTKYISLLARSHLATPGSTDTRSKLGSVIEGSLKMAQSTKVPKQGVSGTHKLSIPSWYSNLSEASSTKGYASPRYAIRSAAALGQVYGLSILHPTSGDIEDDPALESEGSELFFEGEAVCEAEAEKLLESSETKIIKAACSGQWGADTKVEPTVVDTAVLVAKLQALDVPVLPPDLGSGKSPRSLGLSSIASERADWKPKVDGIIASSSPVNGHSACATRLAVSADQSFFVSASHDGTCRVWELKQLKDSDGILESSAVYTGLPSGNTSETSMSRINDVTIVENSHSVASGGSDGSVHVWRVDMVSSKKASEGGTETITVSGSTDIRKIENSEGEVLAVSHFNALSASLLMFATQSCVHSWDLRSPREPFKLEHQPDLGYQTAMALGTDRNWMVTGTSKGFVALWDIRFQQTAKLWRHSSGSQVRRLETSTSSLSRHRQGDADRPMLLVSSGQNECALFDVISGLCHQSFRVTNPSSQMRFSSNLPSLSDVPVTSGSIRAGTGFGESTRGISQYAESCINAMIGSFSGDRSYLITGGDDCCIRYWDFKSPAKCYTVSGLSSAYQRASYERIDSNGGRTMICQQARSVKQSDIESSRLPRMLQKGTARPDSHNFDSIQDLRLVNHPMHGFLSCSRDGLVRVWH